MSQPTYIVSGFPRSGTSMMMRALDAGGVRALHSPRRDREVMSVACGEYHPNPHGFFELLDLRRCPWHKAAGKCVKVLSDNIRDLLPEGNYRAVYMVRDPEEIRDSFAGVMSSTPTREAFQWLYDYAGRVADDVARLVSKGAEAVQLRYADVVANPLRELSRLGWPIDVIASAATIDSALYRNKRAA